MYLREMHMEEKRKLWNRDYILMLQGSAISYLGDILYSTAIGYWVYEKTGSNALLGIMSSISGLVVMAVSPFSGSITDKLDRKKVIVGMDILRGIVMVFAGILALSDTLTAPMVLVFAFIAALCSVFFSPCVSTALIDIIPHEHMVRGQSAYNSVNSLISLTGKAISGMLITFLGFGPIIILNGISYFISAFTEMFIRIPKTVQQGEKVTVSSLMHDLKVAGMTIFKDPFLKMFIPAALILNLIGAGSTGQMLPFVLNKGFSVDFYGLLMAVDTAGSLACVMLLSVLNLKNRTRYYLMGGGFILSSVVYAFAYLCTDRILMMVLFFIGCFMNVLGNSVFNASLKLALPDENRGAIIGFIQTFSQGGCALSALAYGFLCESFNITIVFVIGTLMTIIPSGLVCFNPATKKFIETH